MCSSVFSDMDGLADLSPLRLGAHLTPNSFTGIQLAMIEFLQFLLDRLLLFLFKMLL